MTCPEENSENPNVARDEVERNIEIRGKQNSRKTTETKANFEKPAEIPATTSGHLWSRATAFNISRVTVHCFPFDVIVFAMFPAHGIWRATVSLLDVMQPWTSQWMGAM